MLDTERVEEAVRNDVHRKPEREHERKQPRIADEGEQGDHDTEG